MEGEFCFEKGDAVDALAESVSRAALALSGPGAGALTGEMEMFLYVSKYASIRPSRARGRYLSESWNLYQSAHKVGRIFRWLLTSFWVCG